MRGFVGGGSVEEHFAMKESPIPAAISHDPIANSSMIQPEKNDRHRDCHGTRRNIPRPRHFFSAADSF